MEFPEAFDTRFCWANLQKATRAPPADKIVNWRLLLRAAVVGGVTATILFQANGMKGERV